MKATIHPYKGYLNTEFQLLSQFRESVSFLESYNIDEIDDDTFLIIQNELRLIAS